MKQELPDSLRQEAQRFQQYLDAFDPWCQTIVEEGYTSRMMDSPKAEAARYGQALEKAQRATTQLERERDDVVEVANRHYKAYQEIESQLISVSSEIAQLVREFQTSELSLASAKEEIERHIKCDNKATRRD